jgi:hypothetical protein
LLRAGEHSLRSVVDDIADVFDAESFTARIGNSHGYRFKKTTAQNVAAQKIAPIATKEPATRVFFQPVPLL